jgi:tyrosine-protein kinase Etk/Wzc
VLHEDQKRVIVIDADLRSGSLARALQVESTRGLVEVVTGESKLEEALQPTPFANIMLLPAMADGRSIPVSAEMLFRTKEFGRVVTELCANADVLLFDTCPVPSG